MTAVSLVDPNSGQDEEQRPRKDVRSILSALAKWHVGAKLPSSEERSVQPSRDGVESEPRWRLHVLRLVLFGTELQFR